MIHKIKYTNKYSTRTQTKPKYSQKFILAKDLWKRTEDRNCSQGQFVCKQDCGGGGGGCGSLIWGEKGPFYNICILLNIYVQLQASSETLFIFNHLI